MLIFYAISPRSWSYVWYVEWLLSSCGAFSPARYFVIRSRMNGRVLDIKGGEDDDGADVITYDHHGGDNQQWYQDKHGFLRAKLNDMIWDTSGEFLCDYRVG